MPVRGIRGATTVKQDNPDAILEATRELIEEIVKANPGLNPEDIAVCFFSVTPDLQSTFPAQAARQLGWQLVPLMCAQEIAVTGSLPGCIRVLILWNTEHPQTTIKHIYLREAISLRPDLSVKEESNVDYHAS